MPREFEPDHRVLLINQSDGLNLQLRGKIEAIESKAKAIRAEGKRPRIELAHELDELRALHDSAKAKTINNIQSFVAEEDGKWKKKRDAKPEAELLKLKRAEMKIQGLGADEKENLVNHFVTNNEALSLEEAEVLAINATDAKQRQIVRDHISNTYLDRPYLRENDELRGQYERSKFLEETPPGAALLHTEEGPVAVDIEHLVDFEGIIDE